MRKTKLDKLFGSFKDSAELIGSCPWALKRKGFGMIRFYHDGKKYMIDNEYLDKKTIKKILCIAVDRATLKD